MKKTALSIALLLCFYLAFFAPARGATPTRLSASGPSPAVATQVVGQPVSPATFVYRLTTNRGWINWKVVLPPWLKASATSGRTAATVTITVVGQPDAGVLTGSIAFVASMNTVSFPAQLTVTAAAPPPPPPPPPPPDPTPVPPPATTGCPGALLDDVGGKLLDAQGGAVTCP